MVGVWYVYYLVDSRKNIPFYVGKGRGARAFVHEGRALKWAAKGRPTGRGINAKLWNKILSLHAAGASVIVQIVAEFDVETDALIAERAEIAQIGLDNLCNLTEGGEGERRSPESRAKLSASLRAFYASPRGVAVRAQLAQQKRGASNPRFGVRYNAEVRATKGAALNSVPRWNKGLRGDPRSRGPAKGTRSHNALTCRLRHVDGRIVEATSLRELAKLSSVSLPVIARMRKDPGKQSRGWRLEVGLPVAFPLEA